MRLESNAFGNLLVPSARALDWALKAGQGTFWVGNVLPLFVAGLAATLLCNEFQSRALRAFIFLQVAHDLVIQMGSVLKQIDQGDVASLFVVQSLVFLVGTLCLLWSVRIGQPRSRLVGGDAQPSASSL